MNRRISFLALALLVFMQASHSVLAQEKELTLVKVEGGTQFEISNLKDEFTIRIPVTFQPGVNAVTPKLIDVALGKVHSQGLIQTFEVAMEEVPPELNRVAAMLIRVQPKQLQQGTYHLLIGVQASSARPAAKQSKSATAGTNPPVVSAGAAHQFLKIEVNLPAAKLLAPGTVVIDQIVPFLFSPRTPDEPKLTLTEISGRDTRLTDVSINQSDIPGGVNKATDARVVFTPLAEIAPSSPGSSTISLSKAFPLGTTKGTALITSRQLTEPMSFSFEVRARRSEATIVLFIILGLLVGFIARTWSNQRIELQEARLKAIDAGKIIERELQNRRDTVFHQRIEPVLAALLTAIDNAPKTDLTNQVTNANAQLAAALNDLDVRRVTAKGDLQALTSVVNDPSWLSANVAAALTIDPHVLDDARTRIELDDIAEAQRRLNETVAALRGRISPVLVEWRGNTKSFLEQVVGLAPFLPPSGIAEEAAALGLRLDELPLNENPQIGQIATLIASVRSAGIRVNEFLLRRIKVLLGASAYALRARFAQVSHPDPASINVLLSAMDRLPQQLLEWAETPETGAQKLPATLEDLEANWRQALLNQIKGDNAAAVEAAKTAVADLMKEGKFLDGAARVLQFLHDYPPAARDEAFRKRGVSAARMSFLSMDLTAGGPFEKAVTILQTIHEKTILPQFEELRVRSWREIMLAKGIRFIIAGIGIVAIGYVLFANKFVGTFSDLLAVFVWAFGVDISIDALIDAGKKLKTG